MGLVHRAVVIYRQQMHMGHTQVFDVIQSGGDAVGIDSAGFRQPQILALVVDTGAFVNA